MAVESNMQAVMQAVSQALQYDDSNNNQAAYISYLNCVQQVSCLLLQDASKSVRVTPESSKCIKLGQHCMERISKLYEGLEKDTPKEPPRTYNLQSSTNSSPDIRKQIGDGTFSRVQDPSLNLPELPTPNALMQSYLRRSNENSPMVIALRKNQQLMAAYKSRMQKMSSKRHCATNMSLSIQRRMAENVAIARAREQALAKKLQERQQRLEAEAARRFASTTGMSKDEQERRRIYSQVLLYEADVKPLLQWREKLTQSPEDPKLIQDLIRCILRNGDHPLTQLLVKLQYSVYDKVRPVVRSYYHELNRVTVPYVPSPTEASSPSLKEPLSSTTDETNSKSPSNESPNISDGVKSSSSTESDSNDQHSPTKLSRNKTFSDSCRENKKELEDALVQNNELTEKLKTENKKAVSILKDLTDTQQFDDLFDEDEDEEPSGTFLTEGTLPNAGEIDIVKDLADIDEKEKLNSLKKEALIRHRDDISNDVKTALEKLMSMFTVAYEQLDSAIGREICGSSLEEPFFKPLWPYILTLFRLASYDQEVKAAVAMTNLLEVTPRELDIKEKYYCKSTDAVPFQRSMEELGNLTTLVCPLAKLECTVRTCRLIVQIMEENAHEESSDTPAMGADDLLPVLAYVIIQCRRPEFVAECQAMEEFIHEGYLMGEEGYCLTSLETALNYVISMNDDPSPNKG